MTTTEAGTWIYCRIGIPGEGFAATREECEAYAQQECAQDQGSAGMDRGDVFLLSPAGEILVPADRSQGFGISEWVPCPSRFFETELELAGWTLEDLAPPGHEPSLACCATHFNRSGPSGKAVPQ